MSRKGKWALVVLAGLVVIALAVAVARNSAGSRRAGEVSLDDLIEHPERYTDTIAVVGRVTEPDASRGTFLLACEDACFAMPVRFAGALPADGSEVVVNGQVKQDEPGRYRFDAQKVERK